MTRCTSYLRSRGVFRYSGRRCELAAGHDGRHTCAARMVDPFARMTWGRAR